MRSKLAARSNFELSIFIGVIGVIRVACSCLALALLCSGPGGGCARVADLPGAEGGARPSVRPDGGIPGDLVIVCGQVLHAVVRDFRGSPGPNGEPKNPDFEFQVAAVKGIVAPLLGDDEKPVYAPIGPTAATNGPQSFAEWYRDVPGMNVRFEIDLPLVTDAARPATFVYDSDAFFPIDNRGFGNQYQAHNYDFTTELHFNFPYRGGETFTFRGDDDVWVFVNRQLAIDLGGVHSAEAGSVNLDQRAADFGIVPGQSYRMDIFQAERHLSGSTFHVESTLQCIDNVAIP